MQIQHHLLPAISSGSQRQLQSLHFGQAKNGRKTYIQASLHADEIPGMLVAYHLRQKLLVLEDAGKIEGEIVLVPVANPIGLAQSVGGQSFGRFDLPSGINFNRGYYNLLPELKQALQGKLGDNASYNVHTVRQEARRILQQWPAVSESEVLKKTLQLLAIDADIVLDLHCDNEAVMHLYTGTPLAEMAQPLASLLGAQALLLARESGDDPFDETCSRLWWELAEHFGQHHPLPLACLSVTLELRGQVEVNHMLAEKDANAILAFLSLQGHIQQENPALPPPLCQPTPLEGVEPLRAPHAGVIVFYKAPGDFVKNGDLVCDVIDPLSGQNTAIHAGVSGTLFARCALRYAQCGADLAKIAGPRAYRSGKLLSL